MTSKESAASIFRADADLRPDLTIDEQRRNVGTLLYDDWHVVADAGSLRGGVAYATHLFDIALLITLAADGTVEVARARPGPPVATALRYGFVWACLGSPSQDIVDIPEASEPGRLVVTGGSIGVAVSGLRAVENFLDMGHFPFVHTGWLGEEPHTEVRPYDVSVTDDGIVASNCVFFQPVASPASPDGADAHYIYEVKRAYTAVLHKNSPIHEGQFDCIVLFVQPVGAEQCIAHPLLAYHPEEMTPAILRWFMQLIFAQDKPILENHRPRRLPLDPRAEMPIQSDRLSIAYRRWLTDRRVTYGAIPAGVQP